MFFEEDRIPKVRKMILAKTEEERRKALEALLPLQREDFIGIYEAMEGRPVTVRLLTLHYMSSYLKQMKISKL